MATILWFRCRSCGSKIKASFESDEDEMPDCPVCEAEQGLRDRLDFDKPVNIAFGSVTNRAVEITQKVAEDVYGLTNIRGSAGGDAKTHDIGEPSHPKLTPIQQKMADAWQTAQAGRAQLPAVGSVQPGSLMEAARAATYAAKVSGSPDPIRTAIRALKEHGGDALGPQNNVLRRKRG